MSAENRAAAPAGTEGGVIVTSHAQTAKAGRFSQAPMNQRPIFGLAKAKLKVSRAWRLLKLDFAPLHDRDTPNLLSPFRQESNPSFSIYDDGRGWKDHGTGEGGDVIAFIAKALNCDYTGVRKWLFDHLDVDQDGNEQIRWPGELIEGYEETWRILAERRNLLPFSVQLMVHWDLLRFVEVPWDGKPHKCYVVTDDTNRCAEIRRCNAKLFGKKKAFPLYGVRKNWPVGTARLKYAPPSAAVLMVEGATDFLTAWDLVVRGGLLWNRWLPAAVLGASCKSLDPEAANLFRGRHVRIVGHADPAGDSMMKHWTGLLLNNGCSVSNVILDEGLDLTDHHRLGTVNLEELFKP